MGEFFSGEGLPDGEYREWKRTGTSAAPGDRQYLDFLEGDIGNYDSLDALERATHLIHERVRNSRSKDAALRLRDLNVTRVMLHMMTHTQATLEGLKEVRAQLMDFPFAYDELRERAYAKFDHRLERACESLLQMASGNKDYVSKMRTIVIEYPFIYPETLKRVLDALKREESALRIHLN